MPTNGSPKIVMRLADRTFFPLVDSSARGVRRKVILSTSHANQRSVRIDLYKEYGDPDFIGSLQIDNVEPAEAGAAEIELTVGVDRDGNLNARATEPRSGEYQSLSVSLSPDFSAVAEARYDSPRIDDGFGATDGVEFADGIGMDTLPTDDGATEEWDISPGYLPSVAASGLQERGAVRVHPVFLAGYIVFCLAILSLLTYFIFSRLAVEASPDLQTLLEYPRHLSQIAGYFSYI